MTKELILSGKSISIKCAMKFGDMVPVPPPAVKQAVQKGIRLGTKLGRKLQIRAESNPIKIIRKTCGKINRRQLHEADLTQKTFFIK